MAAMETGVPAPRMTATRLFVMVQGISVGVLGVIHGVSEVLKGFRPTEGFLLVTIGAVSVIPNYLVTGFASIAVAVCVALWTAFFIPRRWGPAVFLALSVLLLLVGGGIAHVPFFLMAWGVSTRINKPLTWWRSALRESARMRLAGMWRSMFIAGFCLVGVGIGIWLFLLPPWSSNRNAAIQLVCWTFLAFGFLMQPLAVVSGFARDIPRAGPGS